MANKDDKHARDQQLDKHPLILDGGMSRELIRLNAPFAQPEWSALSLLEAPHYVRQIHSEFIAAGADIITTNSYALVPFHIGEERFWSRGAELAALSGRLAREAADEEMQRSGRRVLLAGCLPPIFGSYEPERFDEGRVGKYLEVLVKALDEYVDFWLGETLSLIAEGEAVLRATKGTGKRVWVSFCPDDGEGANVAEPKLRSEENIEEVAQWALGKSKQGEIEALSFNCCRPGFIDAALDVTISAFARETIADAAMRRPKIGVYANAFMPRSNDHAANEDISTTDGELTPQAYATLGSKWRDKGADIVGGCCGIRHEHIRALAAATRTNRERPQ